MSTWCGCGNEDCIGYDMLYDNHCSCKDTEQVKQLKEQIRKLEDDIIEIEEGKK